MKIIATVSDWSALMAGGDTEKDSYIINIPDESIPEGLKASMRIYNDTNIKHYLSVSFSLLKEE